LPNFHSVSNAMKHLDNPVIKTVWWHSCTARNSQAVTVMWRHHSPVGGVEGFWSSSSSSRKLLLFDQQHYHKHNWPFAT
jgi:hypothetical protein